MALLKQARQAALGEDDHQQPRPAEGVGHDLLDRVEIAVQRAEQRRRRERVAERQPLGDCDAPSGEDARYRQRQPILGMQRLRHPPREPAEHRDGHDRHRPEDVAPPTEQQHAGSEGGRQHRHGQSVPDDRA